MHDARLIWQTPATPTITGAALAGPRAPVPESSYILSNGKPTPRAPVTKIMGSRFYIPYSYIAQYLGNWVQRESSLQRLVRIGDIGEIDSLGPVQTEHARTVRGASALCTEQQIRCVSNAKRAGLEYLSES